MSNSINPYQSLSVATLAPLLPVTRPDAWIKLS